ncbi:MAG: hypothetical protein R3290_02435 [Acidimicrobiia bacterium]|nr:hypothetical protein [Acidimicrobiia bacterium]
MHRIWAWLQTETTSILDRVPDDLRDRVGEVADTVEANPTLLAILVAIGAVTLMIFLWGVVKQVLKAAVIGGILSAGAWYWYFNLQ